MKILYDYQIFHSQKFGGISRYFYELYKGLNEDKLVDITSNISILSTENHYLNNSNFSNKYFKRVFKYINHLYSSYKLKSNNYDIFHPTYYNDYFLNKIGDTPFVLTIHDMIHEIYAGEYFNEDDPTIKKKKVLAEESSKIIAISKNTKKDIIEYLNIPENKIEVIYHGYSGINNQNYRPLIKNDYLLYVGNRNGYKNFNFFLRAISNILLENQNLVLFCAGGGNFDNDELRLIEKFNLKEKVIQKNVSDEELASLYSNASAFIYPSLYEGFGIPILEAFSYGCPAIISNSSCFPEVAEEAAEYFNPFELDSLKSSIEKVIYDQNSRDKLIAKGYEQLKKFTWEKTVSQTLEIYKSLV